MLILRNKNIFYPNMGNIPPSIRRYLDECKILNTGKKFKILILLDYLILLKESGIGGKQALNIFNTIFLRHKLFQLSPTAGEDIICRILNGYLEIYKSQSFEKLDDFLCKIEEYEHQGEQCYKINF